VDLSHCFFWYTEGRNLFLISSPSFVFSGLLFRYRFRPFVQEEMSSTVSCTRTRACGDDVRRGCRLAVVERCRNRTLFVASAQKWGNFRQRRTQQNLRSLLLEAQRVLSVLECLRRAA